MPQQQDSQIRSAASFEVVIGSTTCTQTEPHGVQSIVYEDHVDMVSMLTVEVGGAEGQPAWAFEIGQDVTAKIGDMTSEIFKGQVTALEPSWEGGTSRLVIRALDPIHKLGRGRTTRTFQDQKDSDVASNVGADCGLRVDADDTRVQHKYILQRNESNVAFLKRLAARNNFYLKVECANDTWKLLFKKNEYAGQEITVTFGEGNFKSLRLSANSTDMADKVVVRGWDVSAKEAIVGESTDSDVTAVGGGTVGVSLAKEKFSAHTAYVTDVPVASQEVATAIAKAELERIARQFVRGSGTIIGHDQVRAGANVTLAGFNSPWDGKYYVMATRHVIQPGTSYVTEFTFCSNSFGSTAA